VGKNLPFQTDFAFGIFPETERELSFMTGRVESSKLRWVGVQKGRGREKAGPRERAAGGDYAQEG
jgi:hypothetical protein